MNVKIYTHDIRPAITRIVVDLPKIGKLHISLPFVIGINKPYPRKDQP